MAEDHWDGTHPEDVLAGDTPGDIPEEWLADLAEQVTEWHVLIEENTRGLRDIHTWKLTKVFPMPDRHVARKQAFEAAQTYQPKQPLAPQGRRIYQIGNDSWLVQVPGATTDFHFRVSAGRFVGGFDKAGDPLPTP